MGRKSSSDSEDSGLKKKSRHQRRSRSSGSTSSGSSYRKQRSSRKSHKGKSPATSRRNRSKSRSRSSDRRRGSHSKSSRSKIRLRSRSRSRSGRSQSGSDSRVHTVPSRSPSIEEIKIDRNDIPVITIKSEEKTVEVKHEMSTAEQLKAKMQMALKAAADADAALRERGILTSAKTDRHPVKLEKEKGLPAKTEGSQQPLTVSDQMNRAQIISDIDSAGFHQQEFKSGRNTATAAKSSQNPQIDDHDIVIFGTSAETKALTGSTLQKTSATLNSLLDRGQIAHENLYADQAAKQERWIKRLHNMRQKKLNGEAMS